MPLLLSQTTYAPPDPNPSSTTSKIVNAVIAVFSIFGLVYIVKTVRNHHRDRNRRGRMKKNNTEIYKPKQSEAQSELDRIAYSYLLQQSPQPQPQQQLQIEGLPNNNPDSQQFNTSNNNNIDQQSNSNYIDPNNSNTTLPPTPLLSSISRRNSTAESTSNICINCNGNGSTIAGPVTINPVQAQAMFFDLMQIYANVDQSQLDNNNSIQTPFTKRCSVYPPLSVSVQTRPYSHSVPVSPVRSTNNNTYNHNSFNFDESQFPKQQRKSSQSQLPMKIDFNTDNYQLQPEGESQPGSQLGSGSLPLTAIQQNLNQQYHQQQQQQQQQLHNNSINYQTNSLLHQQSLYNNNSNNPSQSQSQLSHLPTQSYSQHYQPPQHSRRSSFSFDERDYMSFQQQQQLLAHTVMNPNTAILATPAATAVSSSDIIANLLQHRHQHNLPQSLQSTVKKSKKQRSQSELAKSQL